ncbi:hypothetical protein T09_9520 [Trichinella sp. T9]|nr:hypothetical protein T09_9520 [Trichinella sp. T9]
MKEKQEYIILTPTSKPGNRQLVELERKLLSDPKEVENIDHIGAGIHEGIIVCNYSNNQDLTEGTYELPEYTTDFHLMLFDKANMVGKEEIRRMHFYFASDMEEAEYSDYVRSFIELLLVEFPKDYAHYFKRMIKLMQKRFTKLRKILVDIATTRLITDQSSESDQHINSVEESVSIDTVKEALEHAFPNSLKEDDIADLFNCSVEVVRLYLTELMSRGLIAQLENCQWIRVNRLAEFQNAMVKQMPKVGHSDTPTVAIVTYLYVEKIAVDAMIENRKTYVRYKTDGESNVYTLGNIGNRRVVSTKLSAVGQTRSAMISSGSITTRLLGGFPEIEHVFIVGVGGRVTGYSEKGKMANLGDVVVASSTNDESPFSYIICHSLQRNRESNAVECYGVKTWQQHDNIISKITTQIKNACTENSVPWDKFFKEGLDYLESNENEGYKFERPTAQNEYCNSGGESVPQIYMGPVAASRVLFKHEVLKDDFAERFGLVAFDAGFDSVVESIFGNRISSWTLIRGIADDSDGTKGKDWQPHAALQAAALMKAIITKLP